MAKTVAEMATYAALQYSKELEGVKICFSQVAQNCRKLAAMPTTSTDSTRWSCSSPCSSVRTGGFTWPVVVRFLFLNDSDLDKDTFFLLLPILEGSRGRRVRGLMYNCNTNNGQLLAAVQWIATETRMTRIQTIRAIRMIQRYQIAISVGRDNRKYGDQNGGSDWIGPWRKLGSLGIWICFGSSVEQDSVKGVTHISVL